MAFERFANRIWLASPVMHGEEIKYIDEAIKTNWVSTEGANLTEIEELIREKIGCKYAVPLANGTSALHLAVKLAGIGQGDAILSSDMTFSASVNSAVYEKAVPVFIDSEYETWNMDPEALEKAFQSYPNAKAVMVVNLYGTPAKFDEICAVAQKYGAIVIEDAAESLGATYKGKRTGTFGTYNAISFNGNKIITGSSGGMLITDDKAAADKVRKWSTQSREAAPWYQHEELGYNYRMSNIIAGVVRGQIPYLEEHIARKKAIFERYRDGFKDLPVKMNPHDESIMTPNFWLSCIVIDEDAMCKQVRGDKTTHYESEKGKTCPDEIFEVLEKYNVQGRPIWKPMHMQPIYKKYDFFTKDGLWKNGDTAVNEDIFQRGFCLPSDINMTGEQQDIVIDIVKSCFE